MKYTPKAQELVNSPHFSYFCILNSFNPLLSLAKWFRTPALRLYGTTRVPRLGCDILVTPKQTHEQYIHAMYREWSYRICVTDTTGRRISPDLIEKKLGAVIRDVEEREQDGKKCVPVGRLTGDNRDLWAFVSDPALRFESRYIHMASRF